MNEADQIGRFSDEIDKVIRLFSDEYDMSYASMIGVLHMKAFELCNDAYYDDDDEDEDDDGDNEGEEWKEKA